MMNHTEVLGMSVNTLRDRAAQYGHEEECFDRISQLATLTLNKAISPYDVAMILHCVKLGRLPTGRQTADHYVDGINYLAFAAQFAGLRTSVDTALEDDIAAFMAKRFAPVKKETSHEESPTVSDGGGHVPI
jgi:hypothetical protein